MTANPITFLVIGPGRWGHDDTVGKAKAQYRRAGGILADGYLLVIFPEGITFQGVDEFGRYHWTPADGIQPEEMIFEGRLTR